MSYISLLHKFPRYNNLRRFHVVYFRKSLILQAFTNCVHVYDRALSRDRKRRFAYTALRGWYWFLCAKVIWICQSTTQAIMLSKKKRLTTTTAFLISNISNILSSIFRTPYFKFKFRLIDLFQSDIQTLNGLQIDKGIWQCVNSSWTGVFKNKLVY